MNAKTKRLLIITLIVFILIIGLVLYFVTRKPETKDKNETDTHSNISSSITIEDIDTEDKAEKKSDDGKLTLTLDEDIKTDNTTEKKQKNLQNLKNLWYPKMQLNR